VQLPPGPQSVSTQQPPAVCEQAPLHRCPLGQLQTPAVHFSPACGQSASAQQSWLEIHETPHAFWPFGQPQTEAWQTCPLGQSLSSQQAELAMQVSRQAFLASPQVHALKTQVSPPTSVQSFAVQHWPLAAHEPSSQLRMPGAGA